jgi:Zn-dependent protease
MTFTIVFFGWIFSLCLHEFSHALVAYYGGDHTVREKGYLTFNPLKYTHPVFSIVLPLLFLFMGGIGLPGGAVYIERWRIRNRYWLSAMSLAGPFSNLVFAIILGLILRFSDVTESGSLFCWFCRYPQSCSI